MRNKLKTREELENMTITELTDYAYCHHYMTSPEGVPFIASAGRIQRFANGWNFINKRKAAKILAEKGFSINSVKLVFFNFETGESMLTKNSNSFYTPERFDWTTYGI